MDELFKILKETEVSNEEELVAELEGAGVSEKGIEVAKAIARFREAYGDEITDEGIVKALGLDSAIPAEEEDDEPVSSGADVTKSDLEKLDEDTRSRVEKAFGRINELEKTLEERDRESRRNDWLSRTKGLDHISVDAEKEADRLVKLEDTLGREEADDYFNTLSGANEVAKESGVFSEQGSSRSGSTGGSVYDEEVLPRAKELMDEKGISKAQAIDRVMKTDADLRKRYRDEQTS